MQNIELRKELLLSAQRAILGAIYPEIRAIAVGFDGLNKLTIKMYLDRPVTEKDHEELSDISDEILADIEFKKANEVCEYSVEQKIKLNGLDAFIYYRKEFII